MTVTRFEARNVRALRDVHIAPAPELNLLVGANGSGKTSLLEALYLLGAGRSFVSAQLQNVIRRGEPALQVVARVEESGRERVLGVERRVGLAPEIHLDGSRVDGFAELAELVPAQVIFPQSNELIIGGPAQRRRFIDWGVFHVEHEFMGVWRDYRRALGQRNAALRTAATAVELAPWNRLLVRSGERLARFREAYVERLAPHLAAFQDRLCAGQAIELQLHRGWPLDLNLEEALARSFERDRRVVATTVGPHRAELRIRFGGHEARAAASRGQQKLLVYALKLAQIAQLWEARQRRTLLLLDDVASELDRASRTRVFDGLRDIAGQIFVTAIERSALEPLLTGWPVKVFHVEQGDVSELV